MKLAQSTIDRPTSPAALTCSICPFARHLDGNRYVCTVSETAADVVRGHWESKASCHEAIAQAEAEKAAQAPIAQTAAPAVPAPAIIPAAPTPAAVGEDDAPPNRGDNGRGRVEPIAKTDKALAAIFGERHKQYQQFLIIREALSAIGIKIGKLIKSRSDVKGWRLDWHGDKAGLYWTIGNGWEVASLKYDTELTGQWEGFDLEQHLECNGIDLEELPADLRVAS